MLQDSYPYYLANEATCPNTDLVVTDKYTGEHCTKVALADATTIDRAISAAVEATEPMRKLAPYQRQEVLQHCVVRFSERVDELAYSLCIEAGKPIKDCRGEVSRLIDTFRVAAEESVRIHGEMINLEISPRTRGYRCMISARAHRTLFVYFAIQFPAKSSRAQSCTSNRSGLSIRPQAG